MKSADGIGNASTWNRDASKFSATNVKTISYMYWSYPVGLWENNWILLNSSGRESLTIRRALETIIQESYPMPLLRMTRSLQSSLSVETLNLLVRFVTQLWISFSWLKLLLVSSLCTVIGPPMCWLITFPEELICIVFEQLVLIHNFFLC